MYYKVKKVECLGLIQRKVSSDTHFGLSCPAPISFNVSTITLSRVR